MTWADSQSDLQRLIERASTGDRAALEELLVRHLPRLRAFVRVRASPELRAFEESSDLVQSVCREVLRSADRFRFPSEGAFRRWLFSHAMRKIAKRVRFHRAVKRDAGAPQAPRAPGSDESGAAAVLDVYASLSTPSQALDAREQLQRIEAAFDALSEEQREVVTLAHLVGLSRAEIGAQLGKSEGAVRVILHRALARVAKHLDVAGAD